jgi:hypothetical protein
MSNAWLSNQIFQFHDYIKLFMVFKRFSSKAKGIADSVQRTAYSKKQRYSALILLRWRYGGQAKENPRNKLRG